MKQPQEEYKTMEFFGVTIDVHFKYHGDDYFEIVSIELPFDADRQDLTNLMPEMVLIQIDEELMDHYRSNGWL